jgi:hypothetical protein
MATHTVIVTVVTKKQVFPLGTVEEPFHYVLENKIDGSKTDFLSTNPSASFPDIPEGDHTVTVSKQGFTATADFTIAPTEVVINVPDTLSIQVL